MKVIIDFTKIKDLETFHVAFNETLGFPQFQGNNLDAWIDCMSSIDDPDAVPSSITMSPDESLEMIIIGTEIALKNCPDVFNAFLEGTASVNQRFLKKRSKTILKIIFV